MRIIVSLYLFLLSNFAQAQSLKAPIERVGQELQSIAQAVGLVGLIICGLYFMLGSQEASRKASNNAIGFLLVSMATAIAAFFGTMR